MRSKVHFHSSVSFTFNSATERGALYLDTDGIFNITTVTTIEHKKAHSQLGGRGGGIYVTSESTLHNFKIGFLSVNNNTTDQGGGI